MHFRPHKSQQKIGKKISILCHGAHGVGASAAKVIKIPWDQLDFVRLTSLQRGFAPQGRRLNHPHAPLPPQPCRGQRCAHAANSSPAIASVSQRLPASPLLSASLGCSSDPDLLLVLPTSAAEHAEDTVRIRATASANVQRRRRLLDQAKADLLRFASLPAAPSTLCQLSCSHDVSLCVALLAVMQCLEDARSAIAANILRQQQQLRLAAADFPFECRCSAASWHEHLQHFR